MIMWGWVGTISNGATDAEGPQQGVKLGKWAQTVVQSEQDSNSDAQPRKEKQDSWDHEPPLRLGDSALIYSEDLNYLGGPLINKYLSGTKCI